MKFPFICSDRLLTIKNIHLGIACKHAFILLCSRWLPKHICIHLVSALDILTIAESNTTKLGKRIKDNYFSLVIWTQHNFSRKKPTHIFQRLISKNSFMQLPFMSWCTLKRQLLAEETDVTIHSIFILITSHRLCVFLASSEINHLKCSRSHKTNDWQRVFLITHY